MINDDTYQALKQFQGVSSWALWQPVDVTQSLHTADCGLGDIATKLEDSTYRHAHLTNAGMLLGLNFATRGVADETKPWANFHDTSSRSRDFNTIRMIAGTPFEGSYFTDIIKEFPETDANKVLRVIRQPESAERLAKSLRALQTEIDLVHPKYLLVFGSRANELLDLLTDATTSWVPTPLDLKGAQVVALPHWSAQKSKADFLAAAQKLREIEVNA